MVSRQVRKYYPILQQLSHIKNKKNRKLLLKKHKWPLLRALCKCCLNILKGTVPIKDLKIKKKLKHFKRHIRALADKKVNKTKKKKIVIQQGGFIGPLLSVLAPLVGTIVGSLT